MAHRADNSRTVFVIRYSIIEVSVSRHEVKRDQQKSGREGCVTVLSTEVDCGGNTVSTSSYDFSRVVEKLRASNEDSLRQQKV